MTEIALNSLKLEITAILDFHLKAGELEIRPHGPFQFIFLTQNSVILNSQYKWMRLGGKKRKIP